MIRLTVACALLLSLPVGAVAQATISGTNHDATIKRALHLKLTEDMVSIPFRHVKGLILLPAVIGGKKVEFLFDNGSSASLIDTGVAHDSDIEVTKNVTGLQTGLSALQAGLARTSVDIGGKLNIDGQFMATDLGPMSRALGTPVAGVLGAEALAPFIVVVNPQKGWIAIGFPGKIDVKASLKAGTKSDSTPVSALLPKLAPEIVSFGPDFLIEAKVDGKPVNLEIDYGSNGGVVLRGRIWQQVIPKASPTGRTSSATRADGLKTGGEIAAADLEIGAMSASNVPVASETVIQGVGIDGLLGLAVLGATTTVIDMPKRQLVMFPPNLEISVATSSNTIPKTSTSGNLSSASSERR